MYVTVGIAPHTTSLVDLSNIPHLGVDAQLRLVAQYKKNIVIMHEKEKNDSQLFWHHIQTPFLVCPIPTTKPVLG